MNILHVASEVAPLSKTGGLGDVVSALPAALMHAAPKVRTQVISARYGSLSPERFGLARRLRKVSVPLGPTTYEVEIFEGRMESGGSPVPVYLIEHPLFSGRPGIYGPPDQPDRDYPDNALRFALLSQAALCVAQALELHPDVVHAHDWQSALCLYFARHGAFARDAHGTHRRPPATVLTIHNLAFLGLFPLAQARELGIEEAHLNPEGFEFYGQGSLLKGGCVFADRITAVSPRYAQEIQTPELGSGLDGLLRQIAVQGRLSGILNGADYTRYSPWLDPYLPQPYGAPPAAEGEAPPRITLPGVVDVVTGKARCKADLQRELGLPVRPKVPLCATISRLTDQKGIELILQVLELPESEAVWRTDMQYVILGQGERAFEDRLRYLAQRHPTRIAVRLAYDLPLSHRIEAGADIYLMPSRFEPCGLNQMYSLRYGTVPVVRAVGGLDDSVVDYDAHSRSGTGIKFTDYDPRALAHAWHRALTSYAGDEEAWRALQRRGMRVDLSWGASARAYLSVYQQALAHNR